MGGVGMWGAGRRGEEHVIVKELKSECPEHGG